LSNSRLTLLLAFLILHILSSCGSPGSRDLEVFVSPTHGKIRYGLAEPLPESGANHGEMGRVVLVIPPGQQGISDVFEDVQLVWKEQSNNWGFVFVCPVADEIRFFPRSDYGWFGQGAEEKIPDIVEHLRKNVLRINQKMVLLDIGGNGNGIISILEQSPDSFALAVLAPAFDVDYDAFERYFAEVYPPILVIYGGDRRTSFETWLEERKFPEDSVLVERLQLEPLYRVGMGNERLRSDYAREICRILVNRY